MMLAFASLLSRRLASPLIAAFLAGSCNDPGIEPSRSLVGASGVPSADALAREILYITRGGGDGARDILTHELRPDNSLTVTHTYFDGRGTPGVAVRGKETLHVSPEVAAQVRQLFWRLRPARLEGQGLEKDEVRPLGCERQGPHDFGEVAVAFISEGDTPADDGSAVFELPPPESCNTPAAIESRKVVWQALALLPQSEVTAAFERTLATSAFHVRHVTR